MHGERGAGRVDDAILRPPRDVQTAPAQSRRRKVGGRRRCSVNAAQTPH